MEDHDVEKLEHIERLQELTQALGNAHLVESGLENNSKLPIIALDCGVIMLLLNAHSLLEDCTEAKKQFLPLSDGTRMPNGDAARLVTEMLDYTAATPDAAARLEECKKGEMKEKMANLCHLVQGLSLSALSELHEQGISHSGLVYEIQHQTPAPKPVSGHEHGGRVVDLSTRRTPS